MFAVMSMPPGRLHVVVVVVASGGVYAMYTLMINIVNVS